MDVEILEHQKTYPGFTGEMHPEVFDIKAMPPQAKVLKPGQIPENLVRQFFEKGYVVFDKFFTPEELSPCRDDIEVLVEELAQKLYKGGKIKDLYRGFGLFQRLTKIEEEFPGAVVILHKIGKVPKSFQALWSNERLLNLVEQLIGPDISGSPNWNLRTKVPNAPVMDVPWHQDSAYLDTDTYRILMPSFWIPFLDTNKENGCMEMVEGGHLKGLVATHKCCVGDTWYIKVEEEEMEKTLGGSVTSVRGDTSSADTSGIVFLCNLMKVKMLPKQNLEVDMQRDAKVCPIPYGGMLLFNNLIPHRSLPNYSDVIRWSADLRFLKTGQPAGLFGLKKAIEMRSSKDPNMKIDWETFNSINRNDVQAESVKDVVKVSVDPEFDVTLQGPWFKKWEIVNHNSHIQAFREAELVKKREMLTF